MPWVQTSFPSSLAVNLSELKSSLRVTYSEEDALLSMYVKVATQVVEAKTRRALISRTVKLELPAFPSGDSPIEIPLSPLVSVQSVSYYYGGASFVWSNSSYYVDTTSIRPRVIVRENESYPTADNRFDAVTVNFTAGYGDSYINIPEGIRFLVMALTSHYFLNRAPVIVGGGSAMDIPKTLDFAMDAYRIHEA